MSNQALRCSISVDRAPQGHRCDWCNKLAVQQLTAIGGVHHNQAGFFCEECGEEFAHAVCQSQQFNAESRTICEHSTKTGQPQGEAEPGTRRCPP